MKKLVILILPLFCLVSCVSELSTEPDFFMGLEFIDSYTPIDSVAKNNMNGVFQINDGKYLLGDNTVVGKWVNNRWCLYANHDVVFAETGGGSSGDSIEFVGYIRTVREGTGTRIKLNIHSNDGAKDILSGKAPANFVITGTTNEGLGIKLTRLGDISTSSFHIVGHRGGCRNTERIGISENSIEMIEHAEVLGATGIEIDVKRTSDNRLIIFHDDTFSPRTIQGAYLLGKVENFSLTQIQTFGRLINGEPIPTLEEALNTVIEKTNLSLVWLDIKDPSTVNNVVLAQQKAISHAKFTNRNVMILLGIPNQEIWEAYNNRISKINTDILIEYDYQKAIDEPNCKVWGPRWTKDIFNDIAKVHAANKIVIPWTIDVRDAIDGFLGKVDGILTNYAPLVAGMHYSRK
jgi:glycerophosphoryl diester phosphodiesterase